MITLMENVRWGSNSPPIYLTLEYEARRTGTDAEYRFRLTIPDMGRASNGTAWYFGYSIVSQTVLDGTTADTRTVKDSSLSHWNELVYLSDWLTVSNKVRGTTDLSFSVYSDSGSTRNSSWHFSLFVPPALTTPEVSGGCIGNIIPIQLDRHDPTYLHTLTWSMGSMNSQPISTYVAAEEYLWDTSETGHYYHDLLSALPDSDCGTCTLTCETYTAEGNYLGATSCSMLLTVPDSVSPSCPEEAVSFCPDSPLWGIYVAGISRLSADIIPERVLAGYGSSIASVKLFLDGNEEPNPTHPLSAGVHRAELVVTDSRGRKSSLSRSLSVCQYASPGFKSISLIRVNRMMQPAEDGSLVRVDAELSYSPCEGYNSTLLTARYRLRGTSEWTDCRLSRSGEDIIVDGVLFSPLNSYELMLTVTDAFGNTGSFTGIIPTASVTLHLKEGGKAAAFFGYADSVADGVLRVNGKLLSDNMTTMITPDSTDEEIPTAKAVYDFLMAELMF